MNIIFDMAFGSLLVYTIFSFVLFVAIFYIFFKLFNSPVKKQFVEKKDIFYLFLVALLLFVGIPLPGTGAWTGTLAASFLDMGFKKSVIAVLLGVLLAGVIMGIASAGVFTAIFSFA